MKLSASGRHRSRFLVGFQFLQAVVFARSGNDDSHLLSSQKGQRGAAETADMGGTHGTPSGSLETHGISPSGDVYWNLEAKALIDLAVGAVKDS